MFLIALPAHLVLWLCLAILAFCRLLIGIMTFLGLILLGMTVVIVWGFRVETILVLIILAAMADILLAAVDLNPFGTIARWVWKAAQAAAVVIGLILVATVVGHILAIALELTLA